MRAIPRCNPRSVPAYTPRFVPSQDAAELVNLYHLARTALSGRQDSKYDRMLWASAEFSKLHPSVSSGAAYKDLCGLLDR